MEGDYHNDSHVKCRTFYLQNEHRADLTASHANSMREAMGVCRQSSYPNIHRILQCLAVLPVTSAEGNRSFSQLQRLKIYLRATMGEDRLTGLALMQCHRQRVLLLDKFLLVKNSALRNPRRMVFTNSFEEKGD